MKTLVTLGTDGVTDWVQTPDGFRHNLGSVSPLRFVTGLIQRGMAKKVLDTFLAKGQVMASVEEDHMWDLLAPKRARWASVSPSMLRQGCEDPQRNDEMTTLENTLTALERHVQALDEAASKKASNLPQGVQHLVRLASALTVASSHSHLKPTPGEKVFVDRLDDNDDEDEGTSSDDWGILGEESGFCYGIESSKSEAERKAKKRFGDKFEKSARYEEGKPADPTQNMDPPDAEEWKENTEEYGDKFKEASLNRAVREIASKADKTARIISELEAKGRPFKASKARADIHAVVSSVLALASEDIASPQVQSDLSKLASRMDSIHRIFETAS